MGELLKSQEQQGQPLGSINPKTPDMATLLQSIGLNRPIGLTGLDPRMMKDPRFDTWSQINPKLGVPVVYAGKEGDDSADAVTTFDPSIKMSYLADVDDETLANDMWAVTRGGKEGTSEGDSASEWFKANAKDIMGDATYPSKAMLKELRARLIAQRYGEIRQTHPGRGGYTPKGLQY